MAAQKILLTPYQVARLKAVWSKSQAEWEAWLEECVMVLEPLPKRSIGEIFDAWFDDWFMSKGPDAQFLIAISPLLVVAAVLIAAALIWG